MTDSLAAVLGAVDGCTGGGIADARGKHSQVPVTSVGVAGDAPPRRRTGLHDM